MEKVEIATFDWISEAEMARIFLENNNIEVEIVDSLIAAANPLLANAVGGIKLTVNESDAEKAIDLLMEYEKEIMKNHKLWCPKCDSENVVKYEQPSVLKAISILTFGLAGIVFAKSYKCNDCGEKWR